MRDVANLMHRMTAKGRKMFYTNSCYIFEKPGSEATPYSVNYLPIVEEVQREAA